MLWVGPGSFGASQAETLLYLHLNHVFYLLFYVSYEILMNNILRMPKMFQEDSFRILQNVKYLRILFKKIHCSWANQQCNNFIVHASYRYKTSRAQLWPIASLELVMESLH